MSQDKSIISEIAVSHVIITLLNLVYILLSFIIGIIKYIINKANIKIQKSIAIYIICIVLGGFGATFLIMLPFYYNYYDFYYNIIGYILLLIVYSFILYSILKQQSFDFKTTIHYTSFWILFIIIYLIPILIIPIWLKTTYEILDCQIVVFFWSILILMYYFLLSNKVMPFIKNITFRKKKILTEKLLTVKSAFDSITGKDILIQEIFKNFSTICYSQCMYLIFNSIKNHIYYNGKVDESLNSTSLNNELLKINIPDDILNKNQIKSIFKANSYIRRHNIQIISCLKYQNKVIGFILLGEKINNRKYDYEDINFIKAISKDFSLIYYKITILNEAIAEKILIKQKNDFFINLVHELKTPLTLIQTIFNDYVKSLKYNLTPELNAIKHYINKLCYDLKNQFDSEKIERGIELYNHAIIVNISKLLKQEIEIFKLFTNKKGITLTSSCKASLFSKIDPAAFERIINNLLDNAIKYIGDGNLIGVTLTSNGTNIFLTIEDNGIGISDDQQKNIFLPYYQISREKSNIQGLGLGLSIVKHIVDSVAGDIEIESELNKGTKITIVFPKHTIPETNILEDYISIEPVIPVNSEKPVEEPYDENKYTVYFIEDKIELVTAMQKSMSKYFNFYYALDGREALDKLGFIPKPDIFISDIMMDKMDGHEFYAQLQELEEYKNIPFIFVTAKTIQEEKEKSLEKGILDYIYKPFKMDELIKKILALLKYRQNVIESERKIIDEKIVSLIWSNKDIKSLKFESKCSEYEITLREKDVIRLILKGLPHKLIADKLHLSNSAVSKHVYKIYKKCNVHTNMELLILFME